MQNDWYGTGMCAVWAMLDDQNVIRMAKEVKKGGDGKLA